MRVRRQFPQLDRLSRYKLVRGVRMQLHWHENPHYRFAERANLSAERRIGANVARLADYGFSFDLQVFASQMAAAAELAADCPFLRVLIPQKTMSGGK